jgi:hypothetical protein
MLDLAMKTYNKLGIAGSNASVQLGLFGDNGFADYCTITILLLQ